MKLTIDFETRSAVDLLAAGPWKYAEHPTTDVLCLAVKVDDNPSVLWLPQWVQKITGQQGTLNDNALRNWISEAGIIEAHNAEFERAIWHHIMHKRYGFPNLDLNKCKCSAARAAVQAIPRKLEKACEVLGVTAQKDMAGHRLMLKMCKPRKPRKAEREVNLDWKKVSYWHEKPEDFLRLFSYCVSDVEAEHGLSQALRALSFVEGEVWKLDQIINQRGVFIDLRYVDAIIHTLQVHQKALLKQMEKLTAGAVNSPRQILKTKEWMRGNGVEVENLQKPTVDELMKSELPSVVREVLNLRRALAKASTAKFKAMQNRASNDSRARSLFMYAGAGTGRWAAKAIQPQNMPRDCYKGPELEEAYEAFENGDIDYIKIFFDEPFTAASKCIRGALVAAPGKRFMAADYSAIEARGNAWLAGQESVLKAFRDGVDLYKVAAAGTFNISYDQIGDDSFERLVGKVEILQLGYQGGIGAFAAMAKGYGINLETLPELVAPYATSEELEGPYGARVLAQTYLTKNPETMSMAAAIACDVIKRKWRADNKMIARSWKKYEEAAFEAVENSGQIFEWHRVSYTTWRDPLSNTYLLCRLPSGRFLFYFDPQIRSAKTPWGESKRVVTCMTVDAKTHQWVRRPLYGGLLCENITQAVCRDLMAEAQLRVEKAGYPIVLHVHDEIVCEVENGFGNLAEFERLMEEIPSWAAGFPIVAKGWEGRRFRK